MKDVKKDKDESQLRQKVGASRQASPLVKEYSGGRRVKMVRGTRAVHAFFCGFLPVLVDL